MKPRRGAVATIAIVGVVLAAVFGTVITTRFDDEEFAERDVVGKWTGPHGQSVTFRPDGTASVKRFIRKDVGVLSGPGDWGIVTTKWNKTIAARVDPYGFTFYGARSLTGGFVLYTYVDDPDQPNAEEFWSRK